MLVSEAKLSEKNPDTCQRQTSTSGSDSRIREEREKLFTSNSLLPTFHLKLSISNMQLISSIFSIPQNYVSRLGVEFLGLEKPKQVSREHTIPVSI